MKKLAFVVSPYSTTITTTKIEKTKSKKSSRSAPLSFPLGVLNLSSAVKKTLNDYNDDNVELIDFNYLNDGPFHEKVVEDAFKNTIREKNNGKDYIFAITLMFSCSWEAFNLVINFIRNNYPDSTIIVGGVHATFAYKYILANTPANYVIRGEGEISFPELIKNLDNKENIQKIEGVYDNKKALNAPPKVSPILAYKDVPAPDYKILKGKEKYFDYKSHVSVNVEGENKKIKWAQIVTSRGCPFDCPYCVATRFSGKSVRYKPGPQMASEMRYLYEKHNVTGFVPEDDFFIGPKQRLEELLEVFKSTNIPDMKITLRNGVNVNTLNDAKIDILEAMGCNSVTLAIESGSAHTQKNIIKKNVDLEKAPVILETFREKNIEVKTFIMVGLPKETDEMREETINYAASLNMDWSNVYLFYPIIGTTFYEEMHAAGEITNGPETWDNLSPFSRDFDHMGKTGLNWQDILMDADIRINYAGNGNIRKGNYKRAYTYFNIIRKHSPENIFTRICALLCTDKLNMTNESKIITKEIDKLVKNDKVYNYYLKFENALFQNSIFNKYKLSNNTPAFQINSIDTHQKRELVRDI